MVKMTLTIYRIGGMLTLDIHVRLGKLAWFKLLIPLPFIRRMHPLRV